MCHKHRQPVENPDDLSETRPHRVIPSWPGLQLHRTTAGPHKLRELPATDPAELASLSESSDEAGEFADISSSQDLLLDD